MSEQIIQVLDYLCEKFGVAIDWTSQNLKPQIETLGKHIINYNIANSIFLLVIGLILTVAGAIFVFKLFPTNYRKAESTLDDIDAFKSIAFAICGGLMLIIGIVMSVCYAHDLIEALCFPEMSILRYIQNFLDSHGN